MKQHAETTRDTFHGCLFTKLLYQSTKQQWSFSISNRWTGNYIKLRHCNDLVYLSAILQTSVIQYINEMQGEATPVKSAYDIASISHVVRTVYCMGTTIYN